MKTAKNINPHVSLLPRFLIHFWWVSNELKCSNRRALKGGDFSFPSLSLSRATGVPGDSFNIHSNHGERDLVWEIFFWRTEGAFDPSSDNSCTPWEGFLRAVSLRPGKPQGRCLVDLKAQPSNWHLRKGLWVGKRAWHRVLSLCQSFSGLETAHRKQTSKGSSVSPEFSPIINAEEGREPGTTWIFFSLLCFRTILQWQLSAALEILDLQFLNTEAKENMPDGPRREQTCCQAEKTGLKKTCLCLSEECAFREVIGFVKELEYPL